MKHSKEPWKIGKTKSGGNTILDKDRYVLLHDIYELHPTTKPTLFKNGESNIGRAVECVNALAGIANPDAWVDAAKRVGELAAGQGFSQELAEALLDMKAARG